VLGQFVDACSGELEWDSPEDSELSACLLSHLGNALKLGGYINNNYNSTTEKYTILHPVPCQLIVIQTSEVETIISVLRAQLQYLTSCTYDMGRLCF
jgi:hypothetical protein